MINNDNQISLTEVNKENKYPKNNLNIHDEFWNDCLIPEDNKIKTISFTQKNKDIEIKTPNSKFSFSNHNNLGKSMKNERSSSTITSTVEEKFKIFKMKIGDSTIDPSLLQDRVNENNKKKSSIDRCKELYKNAKVKSQVQQLMIKKNQEYKEQIDLSKCTFKPKLNRTNNDNKDFNEKGVYERNFNFLKKKGEKLEKFKAEIGKKYENFSFRPNISAPKNEVVFNPKKSVVNDSLTRNYLIRLKNARVKKLEKDQPKKSHAKLNKSINTALTSHRKYINKSASADNSLIYNNEPMNFKNNVHNLHNDLFNFDLTIE